MKTLLFSLLFTFTLPFVYGYSFPQNRLNEDAIISRDTIIRIEANPASGFNFPYYLRIPKGLNTAEEHFVLVETNNTGNNDTLLYHDKGAYMQIKKNSLGSSVCGKLKLPFLMPAFPRPAKEWEIYTHALDRETALIKDGDLKRLDLQLIAMLKDAKKQLSAFNVKIRNKILLNGFSASGSFANRFTMIHPEMVAATAYGGINAILILPLNSISDAKLDFPLGINDFKKLFDKEADLKIYKNVPQFIYMGAHDDNDAVKYDDAYSEHERKLIYGFIGKEMQPTRWNKCIALYQENNISAAFKLYPNIGHETDREVFEDVIAFYQSIINKSKI